MRLYKGIYKLSTSLKLCQWGVGKADLKKCL